MLLIHTSPFFWAMFILLMATAVFYVVFVSLVYYWHEKNITFLVVPLLYTFDFFLIGFLVASFVSLLLQFLPQILAVVK